MWCYEGTAMQVQGVGVRCDVCIRARVGACINLVKANQRVPCDPLHGVWRLEKERSHSTERRHRSKYARFVARGGERARGALKGSRMTKFAADVGL